MSTDFSSANVQISISNRNTLNIIFQVWDTVGRPQKHSSLTSITDNVSAPAIPAMENMSKAFFKSSDACIMVYDITNAQSFHALDEYFDVYCNALLSPSSTYATDDSQVLNFILFGNKNDLLDNGRKREITSIQAREWCKSRMQNKHSNENFKPQKCRILFYEISAAIDLDMVDNARLSSYAIIANAFIELAKLCIAGNGLCGIIAEHVLEENLLGSRVDFSGNGWDEQSFRVRKGTQTVCSVGRADLCLIL